MPDTVFAKSRKSLIETDSPATPEWHVESVWNTGRSQEKRQNDGLSCLLASRTSQERCIAAESSASARMATSIWTEWLAKLPWILSSHNLPLHMASLSADTASSAAHFSCSARAVMVSVWFKDIDVLAQKVSSSSSPQTWNRKQIEGLLGVRSATAREIARALTGGRNANTPKNNPHSVPQKTLLDFLVEFQKILNVSSAGLTATEFSKRKHDESTRRRSALNRSSIHTLCVHCDGLDPTWKPWKSAQRLGRSLSRKVSNVI